MTVMLIAQTMHLAILDQEEMSILLQLESKSVKTESSLLQKSAMMEIQQQMMAAMLHVQLLMAGSALTHCMS